MHDTAVRTANFTECVLALTGEEQTSISHINATSRRHWPCWHRNQAASPDATPKAGLEYH
jgi:hypothetical protein